MSHGSVKSAVRVFEILALFARHRRPLRLRDIVGELGHPASSVSALMKCMVSEGYMKFDVETYCYTPTARVAHLTAWLNIQTFEQSVVLDQMYQLRTLINEPVVMATTEDIYLEYVESLPGAGRQYIHIKPGARRLLVQTGTGWLFLSRMSRVDALAIYRRTLDSGELSASEFSERALLEKLTSHREMDISFIRAKDLLRPTAHWGAAMISMIIPTPRDQRPLAIGVHGPTDRMEKKRDLISDELRRIASVAAQAIGAA